MKPFAALDEVLNTRSLAPAPARDIAGPVGDFQPLFAAETLAGKSREVTDGKGHDSPQIELIEADGRVKQIIVTCRCGERTVLECAY